MLLVDYEALQLRLSEAKRELGRSEEQYREHLNSLRAQLKTANELLREAHAMFLPPESDFGHTPPKAALLSRIRTHLNQQSK